MTDQTADTPRIVILISGTGSNMVSIIDTLRAEQVDSLVAGVISNRPDVAGLQHAKDRDIPTQVVDHKQFESRESFDVALIRAIDEFSPDLVVLAGFMRILTPDFVNRYQGRLLNIHPSLLPKYPGLNTHQRALDADDSHHGSSVHFVTEELDGGPIIAQAAIAIESNDDENSLKKRVQKQEHILYPIVVKWFVEGRLKMEMNSAVLDGQKLPQGGVRLNSES
ncbi:MAG: phosphoribosylglycinamide formyltransferase [Oceanobacter sp.]